MIRARDLRVSLGLDWGSASPGCVLWGVPLPDGHAHIFDEMKFHRETIKQVAERIKDRTLGGEFGEWRLPQMPPVYCDPALKAGTGQIGEDYIQTFARHGIALIPVSNHRKAGWQRAHEALSTAPDGKPWLTIHPRCKYLLRTLPVMVQDKTEPEDLDSSTDDHAADALRYLLMGGLIAGSTSQPAPEYPVNSWGWWRKWHARREAAA